MEVARTVFATMAVNTFFRKSFSFKNNWLQLLIFGLLAVPNFRANILALIAFMTLIRVFTDESGCKPHVAIQNLDEQDCFNFCFTYISLKLMKASMATPAENLWVYLPLLATFQIARNPVELKNFLRRIRVGLGPSTILWTMFVSGLQIYQYPSSKLRCLLAIVAFWCSFIAGFFLRPDNTELFQLFVTPEAISNKKRLTKRHGYLNMISFFTALVMVVIDKF